jgi:hypothetical protein
MMGTAYGTAWAPHAKKRHRMEGGRTASPYISDAVPHPNIGGMRYGSGADTGSFSMEPRRAVTTRRNGADRQARYRVRQARGVVGLRGLEVDVAALGQQRGVACGAWPHG